MHDEQLRYLQKLGLIKAQRIHGETHYSFADLTVIRQADMDLGEGVSFRAVVRNLIELHGGTVDAVSAGLGLGSEFIITLPAR